MTLAQFLGVLTTTGVTVDIVDLNSGDEIAVIKAESHAALEDAIEARVVAQWSIISTNHIKAVLAA